MSVQGNAFYISYGRYFSTSELVTLDSDGNRSATFYTVIPTIAILKIDLAEKH